MLKTDALEIKATMKSLVLMLSRALKEDREATVQELDYLLYHLGDLQQFAGKETTKKLQQIAKELEQAHLQKALNMMQTLL